MGSIIDPYPAGQPILSLPLAEIPVFNERTLFLYNLVYEFRKARAWMIIDLVFGALATASHLSCQGHHFLPSRWRHLIISLLQIPKEVVGEGRMG